MLFARVSTAKPKSNQLVTQIRRKGDPPDVRLRLGRTVLTEPRPLAADAKHSLVLVKVRPAEPEHFTEAQPECRHKAQEGGVVVAGSGEGRELARGRGVFSPRARRARNDACNPNASFSEP